MNRYKAMKINGKRKDEHRYIIENFLGRKLTFNEVVHHINGNKNDNRIENLVVMSRSEHTKLHNKGKKLTEEHKRKISKQRKGMVNKNSCKKVLKLSLDGKFLEKFDSTMEAQRTGLYDSRHISDCCLGKRKTHKGFKWRYEEISPNII